MSKIDLLGKRFSKLVVIECMGSDARNVYWWKCLCDCGNEKNIHGQSLRNGNTKSCGCIRNDNKQPDRRSRALAPIVAGVYKITNPNGEVYIGGSRTIYRRWLRHREARKKIKIHLSIKKYGWQAHKFEIVHELPLDVTDEILITYEQFYMDAYRDCGFEMLNVKDAGSKAKFSEESKIRMSIAQRNKKPWNYGLKNSQVPWNKGLTKKDYPQ